MADFLANVPTVDQVAAARRGQPIPKGPSRLDVKEAKAVDESKAEARWKKTVWARDKGRCRCCKTRVEKTIELIPERGEVHHVKGREHKPTRWDPRNGLLLCKRDHDRVTGAVNDKLVIIATKFFTIAGAKYIDARARVGFKKVA